MDADEFERKAQHLYEHCRWDVTIEWAREVVATALAADLIRRVRERAGIGVLRIKLAQGTYPTP